MGNFRVNQGAPAQVQVQSWEPRQKTPAEIVAAEQATLIRSQNKRAAVERKQEAEAEKKQNAVATMTTQVKRARDETSPAASETAQTPNQSDTVFSPAKKQRNTKTVAAAAAASSVPASSTAAAASSVPASSTAAAAASSVPRPRRGRLMTFAAAAAAEAKVDKDVLAYFSRLDEAVRLERFGVETRKEFVEMYNEEMEELTEKYDNYVNTSKTPTKMEFKTWVLRNYDRPVRELLYPVETFVFEDATSQGERNERAYAQSKGESEMMQLLRSHEVQELLSPSSETDKDLNLMLAAYAASSMNLESLQKEIDAGKGIDPKQAEVLRQVVAEQVRLQQQAIKDIDKTIKKLAAFSKSNMVGDMLNEANIQADEIIADPFRYDALKLLSGTDINEASDKVVRTLLSQVEKRETDIANMTAHSGSAGIGDSVMVDSVKNGRLKRVSAVVNLEDGILQREEDLIDMDTDEFQNEEGLEIQDELVEERDEQRRFIDGGALETSASKLAREEKEVDEDEADLQEERSVDEDNPPQESIVVEDSADRTIFQFPDPEGGASFGLKYKHPPRQLLPVKKYASMDLADLADENKIAKQDDMDQAEVDVESKEEDSAQQQPPVDVRLLSIPEWAFNAIKATGNTSLLGLVKESTRDYGPPTFDSITQLTKTISAAKKNSKHSLTKQHWRDIEDILVLLKEKIMVQDASEATTWMDRVTDDIDLIMQMYVTTNPDQTLARFAVNGVADIATIVHAIDVHLQAKFKVVKMSPEQVATCKELVINRLEALPQVRIARMPVGDDAPTFVWTSRLESFVEDVVHKAKDDANDRFITQDQLRVSLHDSVQYDSEHNLDALPKLSHSKRPLTPDRMQVFLELWTTIMTDSQNIFDVHPDLLDVLLDKSVNPDLLDVLLDKSVKHASMLEDHSIAEMDMGSEGGGVVFVSTRDAESSNIVSAFQDKYSPYKKDPEKVDDDPIYKQALLILLASVSQQSPQDYVVSLQAIAKRLMDKISKQTPTDTQYDRVTQSQTRIMELVGRDEVLVDEDEATAHLVQTTMMGKDKKLRAESIFDEAGLTANVSSIVRLQIAIMLDQDDWLLRNALAKIVKDNPGNAEKQLDALNLLMNTHLGEEEEEEDEPEEDQEEDEPEEDQEEDEPEEDQEEDEPEEPREEDEPRKESEGPVAMELDS